MGSDGENLGISVGSLWKTNPPGGVFRGVLRGFEEVFGWFSDERRRFRRVMHLGGRGAIPTRQASCPTNGSEGEAGAAWGHAAYNGGSSYYRRSLQTEGWRVSPALLNMRHLGYKAGE